LLSNPDAEPFLKEVQKFTTLEKANDQMQKEAELKTFLTTGLRKYLGDALGENL